jgi:AbrB family looped-hinge helix DNA binding protein
MKTIISSKGQIVLPSELRRKDRIRPGQQFTVERLQAGEYLLKKVKAPRKKSVIEWLRSCPETDWFRPIPSESTKQIKRVVR